MNKLLTQIQDDYKKALKASQTLVVSVLRLLLSAIHNKEIEKKARGEKMTEDDILATVQKEIKERKESIEAYRKGKREDLVEKEEKELKILEHYLPQQLSKEELEQIVKEAIYETKAEGMRDFGKVMGFLMGKVKGRAEGRIVSEMVRSCL